MLSFFLYNEKLNKYSATTKFQLSLKTKFSKYLNKLQIIYIYIRNSILFK